MRGGRFREEQISLNYVNEFPGVSFTKREDSLLFRVSSPFPLYILPSFYLFTSHQPPRNLGAQLIRKSLDLLRRQPGGERGSGAAKRWLSSPSPASADERVSGEPRQVPREPGAYARLRVQVGAAGARRSRGRRVAEGPSPAPFGGGVPSAGRGMLPPLTYPVPTVRLHLTTFR